MKEIEFLSCQQWRLVGSLDLLTQYASVDCFHGLSPAAMFGLPHICKCTISASSYQMAGSGESTHTHTHTLTYNSFISLIFL